MKKSCQKRSMLSIANGGQQGTKDSRWTGDRDDSTAGQGGGWIWRIGGIGAVILPFPLVSWDFLLELGARIK